MGRTITIALMSKVSVDHPIPLKWIHWTQNWGSGWIKYPSLAISRDQSLPLGTTGESFPGVGLWESETTAFPFAGTGGDVTYEIEDCGCTFTFGPVGNQTSRKGLGNQFTIHFGNPTVGPPTTPTWDWELEGDFYDINIVNVGGGGADQVDDLLSASSLPGLLGIFAIGAQLSHEIDDAVIVLALTLKDETNTTVSSCSTRATLRGKDLSGGVRALQPQGTTISMRSLLWNYVP
jgi:hypothetical protein